MIRSFLYVLYRTVSGIFSAMIRSFLYVLVYVNVIQDVKVEIIIIIIIIIIMIIIMNTDA